MSLSQLNNLLKDEFEYRLAFLTTKNGKSMRRLSTCKVVNLQFSFFSTPIWLERIFICSITPIMHLIARLSSFFAKKLRRSEIIFVSLLTALKFYLYCLAIIKIAHFLWVIQTSEPFLFQNYVKSHLWIFTCETLVNDKQSKSTLIVIGVLLDY